MKNPLYSLWLKLLSKKAMAMLVMTQLFNCSVVTNVFVNKCKSFSI